MTDTQALPPQNLDAEESVLGAMMMSETAIDAVMDEGLAARDFYRLSHGTIFRAITALYAKGDPVDAITVADQLASTPGNEVAGKQVFELSTLAPSSSNARHYARIVREQATLRAIIRAGAEIQRLGMERPGSIDDLVDKVEKAVFDLALIGRTDDFVPVSEPLMSTYRRIEDAANRGGDDIVGVPSGFRVLDALTAGFEPGNLIIVAARPSMGKSGLALNIAAHVAVGLGKPVGLFTLEMSRHEVAQRLLSSEAMVDSYKIRTGRLNSDEWGKISAAAARLHVAPLQIDDSGALTALELRAKARRLKLRFPELALVIVDYLQLMQSGSGVESRVQDVSQISRSMKVLAAELAVPVIALSQLSRSPESRHDKRPVLSDLRESGSLEQDADLVAFIYRDEYYNPEDTDQEGIAEVNLAKHRNGPTGTVKLAFVKRYTRFSDLA